MRTGRDSSSHRILASLFAATLVVVLTGCYGAQTGGEPPVGSDLPPDPTPGATLSDDECFVLHGIREPIPQTIDNMTALATVILVGTFEGYGKPMWNTPDAARPTYEEFTNTSARIVRPVMLDVETALRGLKDAAEGARVTGGEIGCDSVTYEPDLSLVAGTRYVCFLAPTAESSGEVVSSLIPIDAWVVAADVVETRLDGSTSLEALAKAIEASPYTGIYEGEPASTEKPEPTPVESNRP